MLWNFNDDDGNEANSELEQKPDIGMLLKVSTTTSTTNRNIIIKKEQTYLQPPLLRLKQQRGSILKEAPYSIMVDRVSEQVGRERKKKNRKRRKKRKKRMKHAAAAAKGKTTSAKKNLARKKPPRRSLNGDSSDSDEAIERLEKRSRPKDTKRRKVVITTTTAVVGNAGKPVNNKKPTTTTTPKKSNSKKKRPRTVPGFLPNKDDGYAGFGPDLISTSPEAVVAYEAQRKQALTPLPVVTTAATTDNSKEEKSMSKTTTTTPSLVSVVETVDFERMTGTILGVPIRMPATTILAHFARNRRESLVKRRSLVAQGLANQIDADISGTSSSAAAVADLKIKKEAEAHRRGDNSAAATKKLSKKPTKKKPPKTVLDTPLDEFEAFFLLGRNLHTNLEGKMIKVLAAEMVHSDGHPNFIHRASIAMDLIAEQEFRDRTYRNPMAELAVEMLLNKRKQEGEKDGDLNTPDSVRLAISSLKLQSLGAGCTRNYCAQFLREPLWDERPCVNGDLCMGMTLPIMCPEITSTTKTEACIILTQFYTPDEMSEYHRTGRWPDEEHQRCCLLCSRFRITKAFFSYHARGVSPEETWLRVAQVQDHWNVVGEGEGYTPDETLQILSSKTGNWELSPYPVVMLDPTKLRAATMEIVPHQGRMVAIIEGTKKRIEISVPADHPLHSQYYYHDGADVTHTEGLKKHIVGCFVEKGQDFQSASATSGQQSC